MRKSGLPITGTQPEAQIRVTVSENARGPLFIVEISSGEKRQITMLPWTTLPVEQAKPRAKLIQIPILEQSSEPILDLLMINSDTELIALSPTRLATFQMSGGKWAPTGAVALSLSRPPARDPRGRLQGTVTSLHAYLPGSTCTGALQPAIKMTCAAGNETWLLDSHDPNSTVRWITDRNLLESAGMQASFYEGAYGWFAAPGSRTIDRTGASLQGSESWGSDFTAIENPCGSNPAVLAAAQGDNTDRDQIQLYEIANGHAAPSSAPIELPGPVTALWPAETSSQATLVIRNSKTGNYEASRLGVACAE